MWAKHKDTGFTIVELLIVIVVIAVLAAISIVAYNGIQQRGRDSQRKSDITAITKALELYYIDNGKYPNGGTLGSTTINSAWSSTSDSSWANLQTILSTYISRLPADPISTQGANPTANAATYNYAYYGNTSTFCGSTAGQMYIIIYRLEAGPQEDTTKGVCSSNVLYYAGSSNYRVIR